MADGAQSEIVAWRVIAASGIGTSHLKHGLPCQDAYAFGFAASTRGDKYFVAVIADGAGSVAYSKTGASLACQTWLARAREWLANDPLESLDIAQLEEWLRYFQKRVEGLSESNGVLSREFACTLLLAIVGERSARFIQIGDGAMVISSREMPGRFGPVFWPERGEFANQTVFATSPEAFESMQSVLLEEVVDEIALFSDGIQSLVLDYRAQTASNRWFDGMFMEVRRIEAAGFSEGASRSLAEYLSSKAVNDRTDDDKTLILASRRGAQTPKPLAPQTVDETARA